MNYDAVLSALIILSFFGIIIILIRKIPEISSGYWRDKALSDALAGEKGKSSKMKNLLFLILIKLEKFLRQIRIYILKLDGKTFAWIEHLRKKSSEITNNANKISLKLHFKIEESRLLNMVARNPKNPENYKKLGLLYFQNKNFKDAGESLKEYLKLNPGDDEIKKIMGEMPM
ncbi:hypothetical protein KKG29_03330 [Patescibacteria group bacterium]|nr:hypothetical protein [Patescibacteria group bacterium]MBU4000176.1 hypothetical protein [Patescibacteria group bacterium]MBU4056425.1 hypothetical protein [Patescibacteria group bacterium]MBU4368678.1 hypothetical protein [Patescibacteria group bacterium]